MNPAAGSEKGLQNSVQGWQDYLRGAGTQTGLDSMKRLVDAGTNSTAGTYFYAVPCFGANAVDITLRASTLTGTVTVTAYKTLGDGFTEKMDATGASAAITITLVAATQKTGSITTLRGERIVILKIVIAGSSSVAFDQAEFSAI